MNTDWPESGIERSERVIRKGISDTVAVPRALATALLVLVSLVTVVCGDTVSQVAPSPNGASPTRAAEPKATQAQPPPMVIVATRAPEPTAVPTAAPAATAVPVVSWATLPTLTAIHEGRTIWAHRYRGCWTPDSSSEMECAETSPVGLVQNYMEVENGDSIEVQISPDSRPSRLQATFFAHPGWISAGDVVHLSPVERVLDVDMPAGRYDVVLHAQWQEGGPSVRYQVDYVFGITVAGEPLLRRSCTSTLIGGVLGIVIDSLYDRARTATDQFNGTGCRFTREISEVVLTLESENRRYVETFRLEPPSLSVDLPLREDIASESTGGPLPPGLYSRRIVAITVDGVEKKLPSGDLGVIRISDVPADPDAPVVLLQHHEEPRIYATSTPEYIRGSLKAREGCMYIRNGDIPVWPSVFSMREQEGRVEILDHRGTVVARDAQQAILKGRPVGVTEPLGMELTREIPPWCPPGNFWIVDAPPGAATKMLFPDAQPSPDWTLYEVSGSGSARGFSIKLPSEWELMESRGIDSLLGDVVGDGVRLMYNHGDFTRDLDPADLDDSHTIFREVVSELEARILVPTFGTEGTTGVFFESLGGARFSLSGEDLTPEQQRIAVGIFRGIRGLGP